MSRRFFNIVLSVLLLAYLSLSVSCNSTKYLTANQYLLRQNKVILNTETPINNKGEMRDNLARLIVQKPNYNSYDILPFKLPIRLWRYNRRYDRLHNKPDSLLTKSVERPVILDTGAIIRSVQNMKSYLFHQGYFYAKIYYKIKYAGKKAYATYTVNAGNNFLINKVNFYIDDSAIAHIVRESADASAFETGKPYTYGLAEEERSRITSLLRNAGYYKFTQDNITFKLDTFNKALFRNVESPFESAINFIKSSSVNKNPTLDIDLHIHLADDTNAYKVYKIATVNVYPDFVSRADYTDSTLEEKTINDVHFKYHRDYVHARVLFEHIYLNPGDLFSQSAYDKTYRKLNDLGIFQYIRIDPRENRATNALDYNILLNRAKKYDFSALYELSNGSTYALGHSLGINLRNRNFLGGANLLTIGVNGGFEYSHTNKGDILKDFSVLTAFYGVNASLDFPKFLAPVAASLFDNSNLPHTIISAGRNLIERRDYFTLLNISANYSYNWRQTDTKTWNLAPAFINVIRLPFRSPAFNAVLKQNAFLNNSYKENFIEGESISFTFDDMDKKRGHNYSYIKVGLEEAGALLSGINQLGVALNDLYKLQYAQYGKFDFDARHYLTRPHSVLVLRLYGGMGIPYDKSTTLPYIKQYFAGGAYSLRGWKIRTLGPGSYYAPNAYNKDSLGLIDLTGDIKLEFNSEYRFPVAPLFSGAIKMNGAFFVDAGNIWLAKKDPSYPGGDFNVSTLGQTIAADAGLGARFDLFSFITFRVDFAVPIKKPYVFNNADGWVIKQIDFHNSTWRANNVITQVSIGYPF